jgi:hypothetical protein
MGVPNCNLLGVEQAGSELGTTGVPSSPLEVIENALIQLEGAITLHELEGPASHTAIVAEGMDDPAVPTALGRYLVGALAGAVDLDARLSEALLARGADAQAELAATVRALVRDSNDCLDASDERFRDTRRNAWIAEGLVHALLVVRARANTASLPGPVHALTQPHQIPSQQGLDAVAIYVDDQGPAVAIGESKASRTDGSGQLTDAASIFTAIDDGDYGPHLRAALLSLRRVLPNDLAPQVSDALWREHRCYLPVIVFETPFDPLATRPTLAGLEPPAARRRLVALQLTAFHAFFDAVADAMRAAVVWVVP